MSARLSDDGGDQEAAYCDDVAATVGDPSEYIVDCWLDEFIMPSNIPAIGQYQTGKFRLASLRQQLLYVLRANTDELERAENAARMSGSEGGFERWLEERDE